MFLGRRQHSREERNGFVKEMSSNKQVVFDYLYFWGGFFLPLLSLSTRPRLQFIYSVCILPQPAFYSQSAVCIYTQSAFYSWSAVCSPQSAVRSLRFTLTGSRTECNWLERTSPLFTCTHALYNISKNSLRSTDSIASLKM